MVEKLNITKLLKCFRYFPYRWKKVTFTNAIKHVINTSDGILLYTKSYPEIQKNQSITARSKYN